MNNPDSSNTSEDKDFNVGNVGGHVVYTPVKGDHNVTTVSVDENIKTNSNLHPVK
jgi:DNA-binding protein YbaB